MPSLGLTEVLLIFLIVLVLWGPGRVGGLGKSLGEGIRNFKKGLRGDDDGAPARPDDPQDPPQS
jgi:sec-independent protein translocase protein TatA